MEMVTLYLPLIQHLFCVCKRHRVEQFLEVVESWTEQEFKEHLRLSKQTVFRLIGNYVHLHK